MCGTISRSSSPKTHLYGRKLSLFTPRKMSENYDISSSMSDSVQPGNVRATGGGGLWTSMSGDETSFSSFSPSSALPSPHCPLKDVVAEPVSYAGLHFSYALKIGSQDQIH